MSSHRLHSYVQVLTKIYFAYHYFILDLSQNILKLWSLYPQKAGKLRQLTAMLPILFTHIPPAKGRNATRPGTREQKLRKSPLPLQISSSLMFSLKIPTDICILYHNIAELRVREMLRAQPMASSWSSGYAFCPRSWDIESLWFSTPPDPPLRHLVYFLPASP